MKRFFLVDDDGFMVDGPFKTRVQAEFRVVEHHQLYHYRCVIKEEEADQLSEPKKKYGHSHRERA